jgi:hypothetical protein
MDNYTVTERLAKTEDDRIVPESDPEARWLFAIPGTQIPLEEAKRYGLVKDEPAAEPEAEEPIEIKQPIFPPEIKRQRRR